VERLILVIAAALVGVVSVWMAGFPLLPALLVEAPAVAAVCVAVLRRGRRFAPDVES